MLTINKQPWYTMKEVAEQLHVHPLTIGRWRREGRIRSSLKLGKKYLFSQENLNEMLQSGITQTARTRLRRSEKSIQDDLKMVQLFREGKTLEEVGFKYDLTRERVRQRLKHYGIVGRHGGNTVRALSRSVIRDKANYERKEKRSQRKYGIGIQERRNLKTTFFSHPQYCKAEKIYLSLRSNSFRNYVPWSISLTSFIELIRPYVNIYGKGQMVIRRKDVNKPYEIDNIEVVTHKYSSRITRNRKLIALLLAKEPELEPHEVARRLGIKRMAVTAIMLMEKNKRKFQTAGS